MSDTGDVWVTIGVLAVASFAIRASGPVLLGGRELPARAASVVGLLAPALLGALIVVLTVSDGDGLAFDERIAGLGAAGAVLVWRRDAVLIAIAVAAVVTALLRALL